jgi:hypothetical protein
MRRLILACAVIIAAPALAAPALAPAEEASSIDTATLALAEVTVDHIWPIGTYARMFNGTLDKMMDGIVASMFDMKLEDMVAGLPAVERNALAEKGFDKLTMREVMLKADPHFEERMRITNKTMWGGMTPLLSRMEPEVRRGLSRAYARKFSAAQLADLNSFFKTPTGKVYAAESMMLFMDPEVTSLMAKVTPELMKEMPAIIKKVEAATAHLPAPPKPKSPDEEAREKQPPVS